MGRFIGIAIEIGIESASIYGVVDSDSDADSDALHEVAADRMRIGGAPTEALPHFNKGGKDSTFITTDVNRADLPLVSG